MRKLLSYRGFRFLLVGAMNTVFGYSVYALLTFIGLHYALCVILGNIIGCCFNFFSIGKLVFRNFQYKFFLKFTVIYIAMTTVGILVLKVCKIFQINMYFGGLIALFFNVPISYFLNRKLFVKTLD